MGHVVAKDFKTVNQVFQAGAPVAPDDLALLAAPLSFDVLKDRGFIAEQADAAPPIAPPAAPPAAPSMSDDQH